MRHDPDDRRRVIYLFWRIWGDSFGMSWRIDRWFAAYLRYHDEHRVQACASGGAAMAVRVEQAP